MYPKVHKILSLSLASILTATLISCAAPDGQNGQTTSPASTSGGSGSSSSGEAVKLTYWTENTGPDILLSYGDKQAMELASEAMPNITIEWVHPPKGQALEQFSLMIVADDKPDIMDSTWRTFSGGPDAAIETNVIQDITDAAAQYMPNFTAYLDKYPDYRSMVSSDKGKLYCIPYTFSGTPVKDGPQWHPVLDRAPVFETYQGLIIRGDWLEELGLEKPRTFDDFYNVLTAFKNKGVQYPFSPTLDFLKTSQVFISAYDLVTASPAANPGNSFMEKDGKVVYGPAEPGYKDYLTFLNRLYTEGLLDPDFAVQDNATAQGKLSSGQSGMWIGYYSSWLETFYGQLHAQDPNTTFNPIGLSNPVLTADQKLTYHQAAYPYREKGAAITTSCKNVEAALTWLDWAWSDEGDKAMNWGREGDAFEFVDGWPSITQKVLDDPNKLGLSKAHELFMRKDGPFAMDYWNRTLIGQYSPTPEGLKALAAWTDPVNGTVSASLPPITATSEESTRVATLTSQISTYVSECYVKFIMGDLSLNEYDNYIDNLNRLGLDELISLTQAALDRYNARS